MAFLERRKCTRYEILMENYCKVLNIEGLTMLDMVKKDIFPSVSAYMGDLSNNALAKESSVRAFPARAKSRLSKNFPSCPPALMKSAEELESVLMGVAECSDIRSKAEYYRDQVLPKMQELRAVGDQIEVNLEKITSLPNLWPASVFCLLKC